MAIKTEKGTVLFLTFVSLLLQTFPLFSPPPLQFKMDLLSHGSALVKLPRSEMLTFSFRADVT